ncbi:hypothetical protein E1B28_010017 [Marasmius oreades]|uniref:Sugar phosphate transporter domain-containing protein n=1 Tax=Marasmius oreades TaxID=181124 RepID=A0A9P7USA3_9AGAR|nr:uncharacterized protein E1B28_010017 [Marasmius oreades]KAG7090946.1 hypothetical protein E1B28_010017 [Marasmius oreades]
MDVLRQTHELHLSSIRHIVTHDSTVHIGYYCNTNMAKTVPANFNTNAGGVWVSLALLCNFLFQPPVSFARNVRCTVQLIFTSSKKALPTGLATSLDIGLSNLSLKTISLSFYTMCKSSSLIFVLLFAFIFRLESFSWRLIGVILLIFSGVLLMVATETQFVLGGFLLVISASGLGGLRWALTQLLLRNGKMGFTNPVATIFWLSPSMGVILAVLSMIIESWGSLFTSKFFETFWVALSTMLYLLAPGVVAFCMVLSEFYILQRAGVVPMSIAGIAKEVTTITISAWFFGDQLTPLNITGVAITVCGIVLFTYHKYRKSLESTVPLDGHGNPINLEMGDARGDQGYQVELDETARLTLGRLSDEESDHNASENGDSRRPHGR